MTSPDFDWQKALAALMRAGALASRNKEPDTTFVTGMTQKQAKVAFDALAEAGKLAAKNLTTRPSSPKSS